MKKCTLSFFALALFAGSMSAATVTTTAMDATVDGSLLKVIADAPEGTETVIDFDFDGTTLNYPGAERISFSGKNLIFEGKNKKNNQSVIIQGDANLMDETNTKGVSGFANITSGSVKLKDLSITGFNAIVMTASGTANVEFENCKFYENRDFAQDNKGSNGSILRISGGKAVVTNCVFSKNRGFGSYGGGALCAYNNASLIVSNSTFNENEGYSGGAIACNVIKGKGAPTVEITNSTFVDNIVIDRGGALYFQTAEANEVFSPKIVNCTFVGNMTDKDGGAILLWARATAKPMEAILVNNLFAYNFAEPFMGINEIIDVKAFYLGGELDNAGAPLAQTVYVKGSNNLYMGSFGEFFKGTTNSKVITKDDNLFVKLQDSPWNAEGDPAHPTSELKGDMPVAMIAENSVAIGAGVASFEGVTIPTTDQWGNARPAKPSVGAVEYSAGGGVDGIVADSNDVKVWVNGSDIFVKGVEGTAKVEIFNLNGALVKATTIQNNGSVSASDLISGVYIAKVGNNAVKFVK